MNQDINQKKVTDPTDQKEEKDFLAREEVKTMGKDTSKLRENEANRERERLAEIKTEEEILKAREREQFAQQSSLEREQAEKEAKEREERIIKMKEEREVKEDTLDQMKVKETEARAGEFQSVLKETQMREEEQRQKFLARVEAQAEGKGIEPALAPLPPVPPVIKEEKIPDAPKALLKKPSFGQKLWIRIVLSLLVLSIIAIVATFLYWYLVIRETTPFEESEITTPAGSTPEQKELIIEPALFHIENSQTLAISQPSEVPAMLSWALESQTTLSSVSRILLEDTGNVKILGLKEFFNAFGIAPPNGFYDKLADNTTLFIYSQEEGNRLGLVIKTNDQEGLADIMTSWEGTMENDFRGLFELLGKNEPAMVSYFKDAAYQEESFRFQTFNRQDLGIVYAIFDDYFVLTTSWQSMKKALDRLKEAPLSFFSPDSGAEFVLAGMSLKEKIGQLFFIGINGTAMTEEMEKLIIDVQPGGILLLKKNILNEDQVKKLIQDIQRVASENYGIPLFIGIDQEGGKISPANFISEQTAQSEIKTADQAYAVGLSRGEALKDLGVNLNLAPVLDAVQPGDFVFDRAFQSTDSEASAFAKALIAGQKTADILTAIKHFPGYGDIAFDPEDELATLDKIPKVSLFKTAVEAEPEFVMTSNVIYTEIDPDLPFSFSEKGIALLKASLGSEPLIMTDDLPQQSLIDQFSFKGVITLPIKAGADILTFSNNWETTLPAAVRLLDETVRNGEISQKRIDDSVLKIIRLKKAYYYE